MSNEISKKDFLKISASSFLFLFIGGLSFVNSFFKPNTTTTTTKTVAKQEKSQYGGSAYGA